MSRWSVGAALLAGAMVLGTTGCGPGQTGLSTSGVSSSATTTETTAATETTAVTSTETDSGDQADDSNDISGSFYAPSSDWTSVAECEPFLQDCPEGEKCVPYGSTGGNWDANKCVPVTGDGAPGDPCTSGGTVDATDDCDETGICWNVTEVEGEQVGVCTEFCTGTADAPICPDSHTCLIANEESITLCMPECDPIMQDCDEGTACYYVDEAFMCLFETQNIPAGEPCGFINDCAPAHTCVLAELHTDCLGSACCAAWCELDAPEPCADESKTCMSMFTEELPAPEGFENIGVCISPPP